MPGKLKVRIVSARNLPVMDRASELTDAFVEVKFGNTILKTEVFKKSLNPQWNSDWFRFEVDDEDLQDEPLQIRVLDHDTYTAHDAIGKIYIDLNPLLNDNKTSTFGGWYPIYDTMHGIQGQLYVVIKLDLFSDLNKFRRSSCGVRFFCTSGVPEGYEIETLLGFVEELTVDDDPEYQWIDKIRSMRASNEARQMRFSKLSSQLQRKIGLKVLEMGGNAVLGYRRCFDLEGESGVVVRAIGTCVFLKRKVMQDSSPGVMLNPSNVYLESLTIQESQPAAPTTCNVLPVPTPSGPTGAPPSASPTCIPSLTSNSMPPLPKYLAANRRLSESDAETPGKGLLSQWKAPFHRPMMQQENIEMMEYPFFTMRSYPRGHIKHLGGVVSATSVKLLDKMNDPDEPKTRDLWWTEIRTEIRSHMRALDCNSVLGYSERTSIRDELIVLSAIGTAAILNPSDFVSRLAPFDELGMSRKMAGEQTYQQRCHNSSFGTARKSGMKPERRRLLSDASSLLTGDAEDRNHDVEVGEEEEEDDACGDEAEDAFSISSSVSGFPQCSICHIPYPERELPFPVNLCKCRLCQQFRVPDIIFCTIDPPPELPTVGKGCLVQARICRPKKEGKGEYNAKEVSDSLPFVEYELHKQLVNKLKVKGMNSLFGLTIQLAIGESQMIAIATATGIYSEPLPSPGPPLIINKNDSTLSDSELQTIRGRLNEAIKKNKEAYKIMDQVMAKPGGGMAALDNGDVTLADAKRMNETFVFEIDDTEDAQVVSVLLEPPYPDGFEVCNVERMPGLEGFLACNLQMFTKIWKAPLKSTSNTALDLVIDNIMKSLFFKFRSMRPCTLSRLEFDIDLSTDDELQIIVTGMCSGIGRTPDQSTEESGRVSSNTLVSKMSTNKQGGSFEKADHNSDHDFHVPPLESPSTLVNFRMGGVIGDSKNTISSSIMSSISMAADNHRVKQHNEKARPFGIHLTPLSFIPRATVQSYVGHLNFFIIRESTSVREEGGPSCFMHNFLAEVMAICRAHVRSLGGNALVSFKIMECTLHNNVHKNQSQCLVNVFGDAVNVVYDPDSVSASHMSLDPKAANQEANKA